MSDPQHPPGDPHAPAISPQSRRKRVVAREVETPELDEEDLDPPAPGILIPAPRPIPSLESQTVLHIPSTPPGDEVAPHRDLDPTPVIDPTLMGRRRRRQGHHRVYRWTQLSTITCVLAAAASVICTMVDEPFAGRIVAAAALLPGFLAVVLSARTSLSMRWRGWAIAAAVFAAAALTLTWIHTAVTDSDRDAAPPPIKSKT
jgi:hypothetical protein